MSLGSLGENLIFIFSQPRAGSTLLQRILGNHPKVHTVSEPWLLLPLLRVLHGQGNQDDREGEIARGTIGAFLEGMPDGKKTYYELVQKMALNLYNRALEPTGKTYFLDKTPRYAYFIPQIHRLFPKAKFIFLIRNPLAVLISHIRTWTGNDVNPLTEYWGREDLTLSPSLLVEGLKPIQKEAIVIHYEVLVREPAVELKKLCEALGIEFLPKMLDYNDHGLPRWNLGDQFIYKQQNPESAQADAWRARMRQPLVWKVCCEYLALLGKDVVMSMGYSYEELEKDLHEAYPGIIKMAICDAEEKIKKLKRAMKKVLL